MGAKTLGVRGYLALLSAVLTVSCTPVDNADVPGDGPADVAGGGLVASAPTVSSMSATSATQGTAITIRGTNFDSSAQVSFNGLAAEVSRGGTTSLRAKVPTGATSGALVVQTAGGSANAGAFSILADVRSISPRAVFPGDAVTLSGSGFTSATAVRFGSVEARGFSVVDDRTITAVFPAGGTTGPVTVVKPEGATTSKVSIQRTFGIRSFSPVRGLEGSTVTILGGGFTGATGLLFGRVASEFRVVDDGTIEAVVPASAPGASYLTIVIPTGQRTSSSAFSVQRVPTITTFSPAQAPLPATVKISGRNLASVTAVSFGQVQIATFKVLNDLLVEVTVPVSVGTMTAPFTLTNSQGAATTRTSFAGVDLCAGVVCGGADQCHANATCDQATGRCGAPAPLANGTSCDDGNACTQSDSCEAGACVGSNPVVCSAGDACHAAATCDPQTGVCSEPTATSCPSIHPRAGVLSISSGHDCDLRETGEVRCWGTNNFGEAGNGSTSSVVRPSLVVGLTGATAVASGSEHTCALLESGQVSCWGNNQWGQLGSGGFNVSLAPVVVPELSSVVAITAGYSNTCALDAAGQVLCWGDQHSGSGAGPIAWQPEPVLGLVDIVAVDAGYWDYCALDRSGQAYCWGWGEQNTPIPLSAVSGVSDAVAIAAGHQYACAVRSGGQVVCWGAGWYGQLGNGAFADSSSPVTVTGLEDAVAVAAGGWHACALRATGQVACWGYSPGAGLGDGTTVASATPVLVAGISDAIAVAADWDHTCAMRANGETLCWGDGSWGHLGGGENGPSSSVPAPLPSCAENLAGDAANCGQCGHDCLGGQCQSGVCVATQILSATGVGSFAVDAPTLFYAQGWGNNIGTISSIEFGGTTPTLLVSGQSYLNRVALNGTSIFWSQYGNVAGPYGNGTVSAIPRSGGDMQALGTGLNYPNTIAIDQSYVYWGAQSPTAFGVWNISKAPLAGGSAISLVTFVGNYQNISLTVDATSVYYTTYGANVGIYKIPLDGAEVGTTLATGAVYPGLGSVDGTSVYWANGDGSVMKVSIAGGVPIQLASGQCNPSEPVVDGTHVYWANYCDGKIQAVPLNGGSVVTLATDQVQPGTPVLDADSVYWANATGVMRVAKP